MKNWEPVVSEIASQSGFSCFCNLNNASMIYLSLTIGVSAGISHRQLSLLGMAKLEVFIFESTEER